MANPWERDWSQSGEGVYIPPNPTKQRGVSAEVGSKESDARVDQATEQDRTRKVAAEAVAAEAAARKAGAEADKADKERANPTLTPGQAKLDELYAQRYADWSLGGSSDTRKSLRQVEGVLGDLKNYNVTGRIIGRLPDFLAPEKAVDTRESVEEVIQRNLRLILGAQFTQQEGDRLIARAFNPRLEEGVNIERINNLLSQMREAAEANENAAAYFEKNGTLQGWTGKMWSSADFDPERSPSDGQEPGSLPQANLSRQAPQAQTALQGKGKGGVIMDPALAGFGAQMRNAFIGGASADQLIAMEATKMAEIGKPLSQERINYIRSLDDLKAKNPNAPLSGLPVDWQGFETTEASPDESVIGNLQSGLGNFAASDTGQFVTSAANAATLGVPAMMAGDNATAALDQMREESPFLSFGGDLVGSGAALAGLGLLAPVKGLGLLGRGNGFGADMFYSTARGAVEGGPAGAVIGAVSGVAGDAAGRGIGQVARRAGATGGPERPDTYLRLIGKEIDDVDPISAALSGGRAMNVPLNVADVAPRLRPMAGAGYRRADWETQDVINQALTDRQMNQGARYRDAIERELGPLGNPLAAQQDLIQRARTASEPFYNAFRAEAPATSPDIDQILSTQIGQQALGRAGRIGEMEGLPPIEYEPGMPISPAVHDLVKRGFDDQLYNSAIPTSGVGKAELAALQGMRGRYVSELDSLYPSSYPQARSAYAGPASIASAMEEGGGALSLPPRQVASDLNALNPEQLEAYQFGMRQAMADKGAKVVDTADPWRSGLGAPESRERVSEVFDSEAANRLINQLGLERAMSATNYSTIGNSATAGRAIADEKLSGDMMAELGANAAIDMTTSATPIATSLGLANRFLKDRAGLGFAGAREGVSSDLSRFLLDTTTQPDEITRLLQQAVDYEKFAQDVRRKAAMGGSALTASGASSLGIY